MKNHKSKVSMTEPADLVKMLTSRVKVGAAHGSDGGIEGLKQPKTGSLGWNPDKRVASPTFPSCQERKNRYLE